MLEQHPQFPSHIKQVFHPDLTVVDFGCGSFPMWGMYMVERYGIKYTGVEIDPRKAQAAQNNVDWWRNRRTNQFHQYLQQMKIIAGDYFSLFPSPPSDVVTVNFPEPFSNFLDRVRMGDLTQAIWHQLKPGGIAILCIETGYYPDEATFIDYPGGKYPVIIENDITKTLCLQSLRQLFGARNVTHRSRSIRGYDEWLLCHAGYPSQWVHILARKQSLPQ